MAGSKCKQIYYAASVVASFANATDKRVRAEMLTWQRLYRHMKEKYAVVNGKLWEEVMPGWTEKEAASAIYEYSIERGVRRATHVVAEVSRCSHGVGIELGWAASQARPVLCLRRREDAEGADGLPTPDRLSSVVKGGPFVVFEYRSVDEAVEKIDEFMSRRC